MSKHVLKAIGIYALIVGIALGGAALNEGAARLFDYLHKHY